MQFKMARQSKCKDREFVDVLGWRLTMNHARNAFSFRK